MPPFRNRNGAAANDSAVAPQANQGSNDPGASATDSADESTAGDGSSDTAADGDTDAAVVPLKAPGDATSCTVSGREYSVTDGKVLVEERHVAHLLEIGFTFIAPE